MIPAKDPIQHHLHIVAGVPIAVVIETPGLLQHPLELHAPRPHGVDVRLGAGVAVLERPLLLGLAPEHFVVAVAVEGRIDIDQIDAVVGQLGELFETIAAVDHPRIKQGRRLAGGGAPGEGRPARKGICVAAPGAVGGAVDMIRFSGGASHDTSGKPGAM